MALGNPNGGNAKRQESPFKGFSVYNVQVFTKEEKKFKVERSFILNEPTEDFFETEDFAYQAAELCMSFMFKFLRR